MVRRMIRKSTLPQHLSFSLTLFLPDSTAIGKNSQKNSGCYYPHEQEVTIQKRGELGTVTLLTLPTGEIANEILFQAGIIPNLVR